MQIASFNKSRPNTRPNGDIDQSDINKRFKIDVERLNTKVTNRLRKIALFDIMEEQGRIEASRQAERLIRTIKSLFQKYFTPTHFDENRLSLTVNKLKGFNEEEICVIGDRSHLAIKDHESYLIGTAGERLRVIEDNQVVYCDAFSEYYAPLKDVVYVEHLNCYLLDFNSAIYRKDIDDQPPYFYMDVKGSKREGASLKYSRISQRLIVNNDDRNISVVNLEQKFVEMEVEVSSNNNPIQDFRIFGENEEKVLSVTVDGVLSLHNFDYSQTKRFTLDESKIDLLKERTESVYSLAVCDKGRFVMVHLQAKNDGVGCFSRIIVSNLRGSKFQQMTTLDLYSQQLGRNLALECCGYVGSHVLWVGLSIHRKKMAHLYDLNSDTGELRELEQKRVKHLEWRPCKIYRRGPDLYFTGMNQRVMNLSLNFFSSIF